MPDSLRGACVPAQVLSLLLLCSTLSLSLGCGPGRLTEQGLERIFSDPPQPEPDLSPPLLAFDEKGQPCKPSSPSQTSADSAHSCTLNLFQNRNMRSDSWESFCLGENCSHPQWNRNYQGSGWQLRAGSAGLQGLIYRHPVKGHFLEEVSLDLSDREAPPKGLILFPAVDKGKGRLEPDYEAYIALVLDRDERGHFRIRARDRQPDPKGWGFIQGLLDRTGRFSPWEKERRYQAILDGSFAPSGNNRNDFHVPFKDTTGRLRIFHHSHSMLDGQEQPFFYLSYSVKKNILASTAPAEGWMQLAPLASWHWPWQSYFVGLLMDADYGGQEARFYELNSQQLPREEPAAESQSFRLVKQSYHWSGFSGDAWQVQFGPEFPVSSRYRLVFWSEMNNVPAWHINDQLLLTNSFIELWPEDRQRSKGCFEAMSDGLRWNNDVKIIADNPARKVIHWRSFLLNPAYQTIAQTLGWSYDGKRGLDALPRSDEIWTVYPDGSVFRQMSYVPDPHGYGADTYEIAEISVIAGTRTSPEDHAQSGAALELWNPMGSDYFKFRPSHGRDIDGKTYGRQAPFDWWDQTVAVAKLRDGSENAPYIYSAFAQSWAAPHVSGSYHLDFDISWHGFEWQFSHWPVHREPYEFHDQTRTTWDSQVSHSALVSVQVTGGGRTPEKKTFVSLLGMHHSAQAIASRVQDWSYPPEVKNLENCQSPWFDPRQGHLELNWRGSYCSFELSSRFEGRDAVPLVLNLRGVTSHQNFWVKVNGRNLDAHEWKLGWEYHRGAPEAVIFISGQKGGIQRVELGS